MQPDIALPSLPFQNRGQSNNHEALSNEWLKNGQCPLAKSYRALSGVVPLVAKMMAPPAGMKLKCPPAVVAAVQPYPPQPLQRASPSAPANKNTGDRIAWYGYKCCSSWHLEGAHTQVFSAVACCSACCCAFHRDAQEVCAHAQDSHGPDYSCLNIGSRAERIRLKRVAAAEGHGDAGSIRTPIILKTGNRSLVQFFYPLALKVESTIGAGSPAVLVPMVCAFN
jgi:hypothetical protein